MRVSYAELASLAVRATGSRTERAAVAPHILAWSPADLLQANWMLRAFRYDAEALVPRSLICAARWGSQQAAWLVSMGRDGYRRQRCVKRMANDPSAVADRLLAVRTDDPVEQVRDAAWSVLARRCSPATAEGVAPILVAIQGRFRSGEALHRYAELYAGTVGQPLWQQLLTNADPPTRRWAVDRWLAHPTATAGLVATALGRETDQLVADALVRHLASSGDAEVLLEMVGSGRASARAAALLALPRTRCPTPSLSLP